MNIYTIGFTKKTAKQFFDTLKNANIRRLIDVRLNNSSQLAAFTKKEDLQYFLHQICDAEYIHEPLLAPTQDMLDEYKKGKGAWSEYSGKFLALLEERRIEKHIDKALFNEPCVLLCSEPRADQCHRSLVVTYLRRHWKDIKEIDL